MKRLVFGKGTALAGVAVIATCAVRTLLWVRAVKRDSDDMFTRWERGWERDHRESAHGGEDSDE